MNKKIIYGLAMLITLIGNVSASSSPLFKIKYTIFKKYEDIFPNQYRKFTTPGFRSPTLYVPEIISGLSKKEQEERLKNKASLLCWDDGYGSKLSKEQVRTFMRGTTRRYRSDVADDFDFNLFIGMSDEDTVETFKDFAVERPKNEKTSWTDYFIERGRYYRRTEEVATQALLYHYKNRSLEKLSKTQIELILKHVPERDKENSLKLIQKYFSTKDTFKALHSTNKELFDFLGQSNILVKKDVESKSILTAVKEWFTPASSKVSQSSWAGELPEELRGVFDFIENPYLYKSAGLDRPENVLLYGPPGTGKTVLARNIAKKANVKMIETSSGEFHNKYIGVGPQKMKEIFKVARQEAKKKLGANQIGIGAVIFFDEFEGVAKKRTSETHESDIKLLNQLLAEMTRPENRNILVIAATNHKDALDSAAIRSGRLGAHVAVNEPDTQQREAIFKHYLMQSLKQGVQSSVNSFGDVLNQEEVEKEAASVYKKLYEKEMPRLVENADKLVGSDIEFIVKQAIQAAVSKRRKSRCSIEDLLDQIEMTHENKKQKHSGFYN